MPVSIRKKKEDSSRRVASLYQQLRHFAYDRGPEAQLPTMQELREAYGVSQATITGALDLLEKDGIVQRIPRFGVFVSRKLHRKTILVAMDASLIENSAASPFWSSLWGLFTREAQRRMETKNEEISFQIVKPELYPGGIPLPDSIIRQLENRLVHGVLSIGLHSASVESLLRQDVPLVVFAGSGYWHVAFDYPPLISGLVGELVKRGCEKIAFWQIDERGILHDKQITTPIALDWTDAVRDALQKQGRELPPEYIHNFDHLPVEQVPISLQQQGYELILDIYQRQTRPRPDAILSVDDMMTDGALAALHLLGLQPGKDVIIATHANTGSTTLFGYEDRLIIAEFDPAEIAAGMFAKLDLLIAGKQPEEQITYVAPRLRSGGEG